LNPYVGTKYLKGKRSDSAIEIHNRGILYGLRYSLSEKERKKERKIIIIDNDKITKGTS